MEVIEVIEKEIDVIEVIERGPQGPPGASQADVLTTQGDLLYRGASAAARLGIGTAGQILKVNAGATAPEWGAPPASGVTSVAGRTGDVTLAKADVGLGNVDNTSDANKPISTATQTALDGKAASSHTHTLAAITDAGTAASKNTPAAGNASSSEVVLGSDTRLSDSRTPSSTLAHKTSHQSGGSDELALATSQITSGTFDNARVNFAAPANIGTTTPAQGFFTNLTASAELQLPTNAPASPSAGDLYRVSDTLRYRDSSNTERILLSGAGNLANLTDTATARTNLGLGSSSAVTFGSLTANNGTLTASAPVLDLSQTWNNAAVSFTALRVNVTNTNSAASSLLADFQLGGTSIFSVSRAGTLTTQGSLLVADNTANVVHIGNTPRISLSGVDSTFLALHANHEIRWSTNRSDQAATNPSVILLRDGASDTLASRRGTNPQRYNLYGTYTSSTNFERLFLEYNSTATAFRIGTEKGSGGGSARALEFQTDGVTRLTISTVGIITGNPFNVPNNGEYRFGSPAVRIYGTSSVPQFMGFQTNATDRLVINDTLIGFGGTTSSFPALKRSSAILQVRLGDDSAYTTIDALHRLQGTAPATSGATGTAGDIRYDADYIYVCTATNTWKRAAIATW